MPNLPILSEQQAAAFRLQRHGLAGDRSSLKPARLASAVCGIQAQVLSAAQLSLAVRSHSITPEAVAHELWKRRSLVKLWTMRSTLHLHPVSDLPLYLGGMTYWRRSIEKWLAKHGITSRQLERATAAIIDILDDAPMTRRELADHVAAHHGEKLHALIAHGWGGLLKHLVYSGLLVFGPSRGGDTTFVRTDRLFGPVLPADEAESLAEIARRYLRAFGPATPQDFGYWAGLNTIPARAVLESLGDETVQVRTGERTGVMLKRDLSHARNATFDPDAAILLPYFDTYMLGHRTKDHLLEPGHYKSVYRPAAWIAAVVLVGGRVAGTWTAEKRSNRLHARITLHRTINRAVKKSIADGMERIAGYNGLGAEVGYE